MGIVDHLITEWAMMSYTAICTLFFSPSLPSSLPLTLSLSLSPSLYLFLPPSLSLLSLPFLDSLFRQDTINNSHYCTIW